MCKELVRELQSCPDAEYGCSRCEFQMTLNCREQLMKKAADAIEELQQTVKHYKGCADDWYRDACDYKAICEQMKATTIVEAQHTEMYDERDKQTLMKMVKSLPLQIIPVKDEKPRWIPVTERLPEECEGLDWREEMMIRFTSVWCCDAKTGTLEVRNRYQGKMTGNEYLDQHTNDTDWHWSKSWWEPTHWMPIVPLPEPPEEEA